MKLNKKLTFIFLAVSLALAGCKKKAQTLDEPYLSTFKNLPEDAFALAFTSHLEGYVEPCGCTSTPLGGIARFARVFHGVKARLENRISLVDGGNLLFEFPARNPADHCQDKARIELLLSSLSSLGLKFTLPGPLDDALGPAFRDEQYKKHGLSSLQEGAPKIISTPKYDIALIGIAAMNGHTAGNLKKEIEKLKENKKIKLIVFISQLEAEKTKQLFHNAEHVDIVIQGRQESMVPKRPIALGEKGPILFEGGRQGQYFTLLLLENISKRTSEKIALDSRAFEALGRMDLLRLRLLGLNAQKAQADKARLEFIERRIALANEELAALAKEKDESTPMTVPSVRFQSIALEKAIPPDETVDRHLKQYEKSIPKLVRACEENVECPRPKKDEATYVGATICKGCHQEAYKVWQNAIFTTEGTDEKGNKIAQKTGHAKAWQTLVEKNKDADRSCVGCHSIGFMKPGGYCKTSEVDFRRDVQCESCHGAGSLHARSGDPKLIARTVGEETCRGCHHVPHIQSPESFNYEEKLKKILGPGHGEKLLQQLEHKAKSG